jgi:Periplasmic binding protein
MVRNMPKRKNAAVLAFCCLLFAVSNETALTANGDAIARGRRLFETGTRGDGQPVEAVLGDSPTPIPGALLSCAGCHGKDGKGRAVKGVNPPDITWPTLTKPYSLRVGPGRSRPPYTEALLIRAVTTGLDSGGQRLAPAMPRFRLTLGDASDLIAYLREIGSKSDPGVTAEVLSIGVIVPQRQQFPAAHDSVRNLLGVLLDELNSSGGIFGRRIELSFMEVPTRLDGVQSAARAQMIEQSVLAVVAGRTEGFEEDVRSIGEQKELPLIVYHPLKDTLLGRNVFYLSAGLVGELSALVVHAAQRLDSSASQLAVVYRDDKDGVNVISTLQPLMERTGWRVIKEVRVRSLNRRSDIDDILRAINASDATLIAYPDRDIEVIFSHLSRTRRYPLVLFPASIMAPDRLPQDLDAHMKILVGLDFASPLIANNIEPVLSTERTLLPAVKLLIEGLRRTGHEVTRAKLIDAIETIQHLDTGFLPPLSYSPRQHVGVTGAEIAPFDLERRKLLEQVDHIIVK